MIVLDLAWWVGAGWFAAWVVLPFAALSPLGVLPALAGGVVLAPWSSLLGVTLVHRLLPASEPGRFSPGQAGWVRWALKQWAPSLYLTVFQPVFGQSERFLRLALRAFGATLGEGALITSRTVVREPHHVHVGARSVVGEYVHLATSYQPRRGMLIVGRITIGDDVMISAYTHIAPGATIGSGCVVEHAARIGGATRIGGNTRVGAGAAIYNQVVIGAGVTIGKCCVVLSGARIEDGAEIPDGTVVPASGLAFATGNV
jgi:acetyltransferase-like isoleucine patch superfamily enzyme